MLPSISINNTSATYPESINENNNDEVNGLVQELKNLFNGKEGISTCIKHLLELIKNAIRVNDDPYRFNINNSSVTYIDIGSNDTDHITIGIDNQEPIELPANYKDKELVRTIINDNIVEKTHDINNKEMIFSALKEIYDGDPGFIFDKISHKLRHTVTEFDESGNSEPTDLFTWYGKDKKGDSLAIVIKNKTEMITYLSVTTIRTTTTFKEEFVLMVIVSPNIVVKKPGMLQRGLKAVKLSWQNHLQQVPIIRL
ncbi:hypothetical protein BANRA_03911 [Escherichia coli]|nr:conserved hypothetical protein [Escherichia coli TA271]VCY96044.1 hypothetical protein BANRA_03911 [Escherichia coli]